MELDWRPQEAFEDFFLTDAKDILQQRTVFNPDADFFCTYGGRGSGKTFTWSDAVIVESTLRPIRVLVTRELQTSIEESIKAELEQAIDRRGLQHFFDCQKTVINGLNGSRFIFKGLKNNIGSIKSISNVDICLCEEAEDISKNSWDKLLPSLRPYNAKYRGGAPIVIVIFNPGDELDDTYQRWVVKPPSRCISKQINYHHNKYFPAHLDRQRIEFKKTRPLREYEHEWEGKPNGTGDLVIIDREHVKAARFASRMPGFEQVGERVVAYDPAGQGKDFHATVCADGNIINGDNIDEWLVSKDLRIASKRAFSWVTLEGEDSTDCFRYDECGGLGDGVAVFVDDEVVAAGYKAESLEVAPFNAGDPVLFPDDPIPGTKKTWSEMYVNAKAQAHGITAQKLYNTFRFVELGEAVDSADMISLDIEDDELFNKLCLELSTPIWVKSKRNSKKLVESKEDMLKRTGRPSGNIADGVIMCFAPKEKQYYSEAW